MNTIAGTKTASYVIKTAVQARNNTRDNCYWHPTPPIETPEIPPEALKKATLYIIASRIANPGSDGYNTYFQDRQKRAT